MNILLDVIKKFIRSLLQPVARFLNWISGGHLHPDAVTLMGLIMHLPVAWLIGQGRFGYAAIGLVIFGLFDTLDGALARLQNRVSTRGMLLDSVTDRIKEVLLYAGAVVSFVHDGRADVAYWAVLAAGLSICVSYVNAWGEVVLKGSDRDPTDVNQTFRSGLARFEVRMFLLVAGLLSGRVILAVMVITVLCGLTILERLVAVSRKLT